MGHRADIQYFLERQRAAHEAEEYDPWKLEMEVAAELRERNNKYNRFEIMDLEQ